MLHPFNLSGNVENPLLFAADDPLGRVPDLQPVIRDSENRRTFNHWRNQKKRDTPDPSKQNGRVPTRSENGVDEYA